MEFDEFGVLNIIATEAGGSIPVENVLIRVSGAVEENRQFDKSYLTDLDGVVKNIRLPTPRRLYSLSPNPAEIPYGTYNVEIRGSGYYPKQVYDVAVFSGVETTLPINMIPKPLNGKDDIFPLGNLDTTVKENENL